VVKHGSGKRFYVSGVKFYPTMDDAGSAPSIYVTRVSDDDGATWTEYVYGPAPGTFHMQGVDPTNPDRILASINIVEDLGLPRDQMNDSVIVSSDGGKTWTPYLTLTEIGGVAFAPDGRVFIGDLGGIGGEPMPPRGLWMAPNLDTAPTKLPNSDYPVQCLGYQAATDTLYACQHFWFGTVDTMDGTFTTKMNLADVPSMVACDGVDMAATCMTQLCGAYCGIGHFAQAPVCTAYDTPICGPLAADNFKAAGSGGTGTAGMKAPHVKNPTHGCCAVAPGAHRPGTWPLGVVAALAAVLAHRRRRRLC
jgi:MYXO-CTERM domain-containing protein